MLEFLKCELVFISESLIIVCRSADYLFSLSHQMSVIDLGNFSCRGKGTCEMKEYF